MRWLDNFKSSEATIEINPLLLVALFIEILFVILIVTSIVNVVNKEPDQATLSIDDYSAVTDSLALANIPNEISDQYRNIIGSTIYDTVKLNNQGVIKNNGAQVRSDSITSTYIEDLDTKFINFIIDIPDLQQSYRVIYRDRQKLSPGQIVDDTPLAVVYCLRDRDLIYDAFNCKDQYNGMGEAYVVQWALAGHNFEHSQPGMVFDTSLVNEPSISIVTNTDDESDKQAAVAEVEEFLNTLGFSLEDYPYGVGFRGLNLPEMR